MSYYLEYTLNLEEPVKMGTQGNMTNTSALTYLAGSSLRGAFINRYIKDYPIYDKKDIFKDTYFYDAYLNVNGKKLIPVPLIFYADKQDMKIEGKDIKVFSGYTGNNPKAGHIRIDTKAYAYFDRIKKKNAASAAYHPFNVRLLSQLHINVDKADMFRYEAIDAGQKFTGYIRCESEETLNRFQKMLDQQIFYVGGSKGSGYGRVKIESAKIVQMYNNASIYNVGTNADRKQLNNRLCIYALSNILYVNEKGEVQGYIDEDYLAKKLGLDDVTLYKSYAAVTPTGSFNHTWRAGTVEQSAIKAGSYFIYEYNGTLNNEAVKVLQEEGIGQRKTEGFGRIIINPDFSHQRRLLMEVKTELDEPQTLSDDERKTLEQLQMAINEHRINAFITKAVNFSYTNTKGQPKLSDTQLARLYKKLDYILVNEKNDIKAKESINAFAMNLKSKTASDYSYKNIFLPNNTNRNYKKILDELIDDKHKYADWDPNFEKSYKEFKYDPNSKAYPQNQFRMKCKFLHDVIYNLMRGDDK